MQVQQVFQQEANSGASSGSRILNSHSPDGQHHFCSWYWLGSHKFSSYKPGRLYLGPNTKKLWLYTHTHTINLGFKKLCSVPTHWTDNKKTHFISLYQDECNIIEWARVK